MIRAYLVDDEAPALRRLERLLLDTDQVRIQGSSADPEKAVRELAPALNAGEIDVLFLDVEMPGMTGFDLLKLLPRQPLVVFTTAYDQYALKAFQENSVDYLLKPVEPAHLERALAKIRQWRSGGGTELPFAMQQAIARLAAAIPAAAPAGYPSRVASRLGDRTIFVDLDRVTHFYAEDKLTFAATAEKNYVVDLSITDLEGKLDPRRFVRIHRSTLLNLDAVKELHSWFGGKARVRLRDEHGTELTVSRERVRELRSRLGI